MNEKNIKLYNLTYLSINKIKNKYKKNEVNYNDVSLLEPINIKKKNVVYNNISETINENNINIKKYIEYYSN